ncbi:diacylglycerol kinase family protein [Candidatus Woesebacteria bacterium]|nr:diacylglycerol kinase family protein [Candidatus Woesebacteria bacterium]
MFHKVHHKVRRHAISFKHAWDGIVWVFKTQPNYQVHITLSVIAVTLGLVLQIERFEWLIIGILIMMGLTIETINSTFEQTLDCVTLEKREDVKVAKDAAAGAMLIYAIGAAILGGIIFLPRLLSL